MTHSLHYGLIKNGIYDQSEADKQQNSTDVLITNQLNTEKKTCKISIHGENNSQFHGNLQICFVASLGSLPISSND